MSFSEVQNWGKFHVQYFLADIICGAVSSRKAGPNKNNYLELVSADDGPDETKGEFVVSRQNILIADVHQPNLGRGRSLLRVVGSCYWG